MSRSQAIIDFISQYIQKNGYSPTTREIAAAVGLSSPSTVTGHLNRLKKKGLVDFEPYEVRTIRIVDHTHSDELPVVLEKQHGVPTSIKWQGRIYRYDPG